MKDKPERINNKRMLNNDQYVEQIRVINFMIRFFPLRYYFYIPHTKRYFYSPLSGSILGVNFRLFYVPDRMSLEYRFLMIVWRMGYEKQAKEMMQVLEYVGLLLVSEFWLSLLRLLYVDVLEK